MRIEEDNNVFADIINVLLFDGTNRVDPNEIRNDSAGLILPDDADAWHATCKMTYDGIRYGLFSVTKPMAASEIIITAFSYFGYGHQIQSGPGPLLPVIPIILNLTNHPWGNAPRTLHEAVGIDRHSPLYEYVNDFKPAIFDVAYLPDNKISQFTSDFGAVAQAIKSARIGKAFATEINVKNIDSYFDVLQAVSGM